MDHEYSVQFSANDVYRDTSLLGETATVLHVTLDNTSMKVDKILIYDILCVTSRLRFGRMNMQNTFSQYSSVPQHLYCFFKLKKAKDINLREVCLAPSSPRSPPLPPPHLWSHPRWHCRVQSGNPAGVAPTGANLLISSPCEGAQRCQIPSLH